MSVFINNVDMRQLVIGDSGGGQKYRLMINNELKYAKGWINFDTNRAQNGGNNLISFTGQRDSGGYWANIYAFFDDGFYNYSDNIWTYLGNTLSDINTLSSSEATFNGWYTQPSGGRQIDSINDVYNYTDLFKYSDVDTLPQITLYARWNLEAYDVTINNITKIHNGITTKSSFKYKGQQINNSITLYNVPSNTELISYLNDRISDIKYVTWAREELDGTSKQQELREGPQQFTGWYTSSNGNGNVYPSYNLTSNITLYPQFESLVIWPGRAVNHYKYWTHAAPVTLNEARAQAPGDVSEWDYDTNAFPLGSADTYVAIKVIDN